MKSQNPKILLAFTILVIVVFITIFIVGTPVPWLSQNVFHKNLTKQAAKEVSDLEYQVINIQDLGKSVSFDLPENFDLRDKHFYVAVKNYGNKNLAANNFVLEQLLKTNPRVLPVKFKGKSGEDLVVLKIKQKSFDSYLVVSDQGRVFSYKSKEKLKIADLKKALKTNKLELLAADLVEFYQSLNDLIENKDTKIVTDDLKTIEALDEKTLGITLVVDKNERKISIIQDKFIATSFDLFLGYAPKANGKNLKILGAFKIKPVVEVADVDKKKESATRLNHNGPVIVPKHKECIERENGYACVEEVGVGPDDCATDEHCKSTSPRKYCAVLNDSLDGPECFLDEHYRGDLAADDCDTDEECKNRSTFLHCSNRTGTCRAQIGDHENQDGCTEEGTKCEQRGCDRFGSCELVVDTALSYGKCDSDSDCTYKVCSKEKTCLQYVGNEPSNAVKCENDSGCSYNACLSDETGSQLCTNVIGKGTDECSIGGEWEDDKGIVHKEIKPCPKKHLACKEMRCQLVDGEGANECGRLTPTGVDQDDQCTYYKCDYASCKAVNGNKYDQCNPDDTHDDCSYKKCLTYLDKEYYYPYNAPAHNASGAAICGLIEANTNADQDDLCKEDKECQDPSSASSSVSSSPSTTYRACRNLANTGPGEICMEVSEKLWMQDQPKSCVDSFECGGHFVERPTPFSPPSVPELDVPPLNPYDKSIYPPHPVEPNHKQMGVLSPPSSGISQSNQDSRAQYNFERAKDVKSELEFFKNNSPIQIDLYQDLKCGMCKRMFTGAIEDLLKNEVAQGIVKLNFKEFPLGFREKEKQFAIAAKCAGRQDKYVDYLRYLYNNFKDSTVNNLINSALEIDLDTVEFAKCLEDPEILTAVKSDYVQGQALGIKGTPSYTINGILHSGALNYHQLQDKLKQIARSD